MQTVTVNCDLCGSADADPLFRAREFGIGEGGEFQLVRCRTCSHVYTNPRPSPEEMSRYYPPQFWRTGRSSEPLDEMRIGGLPWRKVMRRRAALLKKHLQRGHLLEVGSGDGLFLLFMKEQGWTVEGLEPGGPAIQYARSELGLTIHEGFAEDASLPQETYDVVTLHHVLEHTNSPSLSLTQLNRTLRPEGLIMITVPNFASFDRRLFGRGWVGVHVPVHLHHFTPRSLEQLLVRAGFTPLAHEFLSNDTLWPSFYSDSLRRCLSYYGLYKVTLSAAPRSSDPSEVPTTPFHTDSTPRRWLHLIEYPFFRLLGGIMDRFGVGSTMTYIARKRSL